MTKILGGTFGGIYKVIIKIIAYYQRVDCCVLLSPPLPIPSKSSIPAKSHTIEAYYHLSKSLQFVA